MESAFLEWLIGQAGLAGVAALALYMQNRTWQEANRRERESAEQHRADKQILIEALGEHTRVTAELKAAIEHLTRVSPPVRAAQPTGQRGEESGS